MTRLSHILAILLTVSITSTTATGLAVATDIHPTEQFSNENDAVDVKFNATIFPKETAEALEQLLEYYEQIPNEVLAAGDGALEQWQQENPVYTDRASFIGCMAAIDLVLGSNLVSAAKILKIKNHITALGGVKAAVMAMWREGFNLARMQNVGGALAGLAGEFFGINEITEHCFA